MIRRLRIAILAAMALTALGAVGSPGAQAAEFHCSVQPCTWTILPDGAVPSKISHHVFVVRNSIGETVSTTCNQLTGQATTATKTATTLTFTNLAYDGCIAFGEPYEVKFNGCDYTLTSHGQFGVTCPEGKTIEKITPGCVKTIGTFSHLAGVTFTNTGTSPNRQITVSISVKGIPVTAHGTKAGCGFDPNKVPITAEYTTGNILLTAETDPGGVMADGWWE